MKKLILFVMLIMGATAVSAQHWSLTPEVGMTAVNRGDKKFSDVKTWDARWKLGVGVEYKFKSEFFSLRSGLYYTQRGYKDNYVSFGNYGTPADNPTFDCMSTRLTRHFLEVPLLANFSFRLTDDVRLNLAAGPYVAMSVGDKSKVDYMSYTAGEAPGSYQGTGFSHSGWSNENPLDWGASFKVGLEIKQWVISAGYDLSLAKEYDGGHADVKYQTLSLSVGYKFKIGK